MAKDAEKKRAYKWFALKNISCFIKKENTIIQIYISNRLPILTQYTIQTHVIDRNTIHVVLRNILVNNKY